MGKKTKTKTSCDTRYNSTGEKEGKDIFCPKAYFIFDFQCQMTSGGHTIEKTFACKTCGTRFIRFKFLTRHQRIHTGPKPHICKTCGKRFTHFNSLAKHQRIAH